MTKRSDTCRWCNAAFETRNGPGRPRSFCSQACRQWFWVSQRTSTNGDSHEQGDSDPTHRAEQTEYVRVSLQSLQKLVECVDAVDHVAAKMANSDGTAGELRRAVDAVTDALSGLTVEPLDGSVGGSSRA